MNVNEIAETLKGRLAEVHAEIARLEQATIQPLSAKFADQANDLEELATNEGMEVQHIHEAEQILAALARIEAGHYGECETCGGEIAPARLAALPTATRCIKCAA
ncbi:TraR/DksA family transcriptional regulator [Sandarakinorhabdus sp. AAP62]|uniref:TraR/DksA family transcriptional regulator n=1 Tax=Sandarakinorhabdus sp. AAP62 TaxID=1248916 RepID=UPI00030BB156|nr:TraR/DksA family transcriptional regulator [Sandarakinorhabdus sp. AAP62]